MAEESLRKKWKFDVKTGYFVVWAIFIAYLFMQHRQVGMYFDDFGNASLSYSYDSSHIVGTAYSVRDLFQWSRYIYFHWGGRILYALFLIPLLKTGPHLFMFIQAAIITGTYITLMRLYQLFRPQIHKLLALSILVISFGVMRNQTLSQGYYWASASVLYVWPLLPFVYSIYRYEKTIIKHSAGEKVTFRDWGCFIFLLPFSILSQEQLAGAFVVWILARAVVNRIFEKYWRGNVLLAIASFFLFAVIILAPGNFARMGSNGEYVNQPFLFCSFKSFAILVHLLASESFAWFNELLVVSAGLILFFFIQKNTDEEPSAFLYQVFQKVLP